MRLDFDFSLLETMTESQLMGLHKEMTRLEKDAHEVCEKASLRLQVMRGRAQEQERRPENKMRGLLTYQEAAEYLTVARRTLESWVCQRKIRVVKLGSRVRFTLEILDEFLEKSRQKAIE